MEKIECKYDVGQTVYFKISSWLHESAPCMDCGGDGILVRKDHQEIVCPTCKGKKVYKLKAKRIKKVESSTIEHIEIYIGEENCDTTYYLHSGHEFPESDIYVSEDDAINACSNDNGVASVFGLPNNWESIFSNIPKEDWGVHIYHCCVKHGCKYGDEDNCPVCLGLTKQDHPCETCREEESENLPF